MSIKAEIVAHSFSPQGDELISVLCTFPRIILAEVNTHRMLSKNTSSSRAIPFNKMVEAVQNNPFIPIAWQKDHKGMQGNEYWTEEDEVRIDIGNEFEYIEDIQPITEEFKIRWLEARDRAVNIAIGMNDLGLTKQLCNRLLEPFMWTTMLITGSREGWDNFFNLRCPQYKFEYKGNKYPTRYHKSKKDYINSQNGHILPASYYVPLPSSNPTNDLEWLQLNKGQAEIHIMALAECIWDAVNESTPNQLEAGEWHVPFSQNLDLIELAKLYPDADDFQKACVKISTAMAAHTSYTVVGNEPVKSYEKWIELHDKLIAYDPPHSSPMEHCARAMNEHEYTQYQKIYPKIINEKLSSFFVKSEDGWCYNLKGFIPYRYMIDNKIEL